MRKLFKLFTAVLVLGFLVGCGGGGGGSSSHTNNPAERLSLANITSYFADFNETGETILLIESNKEYEPVSSAKISAFIGSLTSAGFTNPSSDIYEKIGVVPGVDAQANINYPDDIDLYLFSSGGSITHDDALWSSAFDDIDADVVYAYIATIYAGNLTAKIDNYYYNHFLGGGWTGSAGGGVWDASKTVDGLEYSWHAYIDGGGYSVVMRRIRK